MGERGEGHHSRSEDRSVHHYILCAARVVRRVRVGRETWRCGRGARQSRSERYIARTSGGVAPARRVLVLCHSGGPGRFRDFFVPT